MPPSSLGCVEGGGEVSFRNSRNQFLDIHAKKQGYFDYPFLLLKYEKNMKNLFFSPVPFGAEKTKF